MIKIQQNKTLNCLALYCFQPIVKTRIKLDKMESGEVIAGELATEEDIKSLIERLNCQFTSFRKEGKLYFLIKKKQLLRRKIKC